MADFTIRSDNVDVEQIMRQIRQRIEEKRGVDYTEEEVRELANVKLEKFLNPRAVRSELVEHYRRQRSTSPPPENYSFEDSTLYESHRGLVRFTRKLLHPLLKLFFNVNPVVHALNKQSKLNAYFLRREEFDALSYEVLNNIVLEITRLAIEVKNLRMRLEAMGARQEFNERRSRAFEGQLETAGGAAEAASPAGEAAAADTEDSEGRVRRRRRRRGRRREGASAAANEQGPGEARPDAGSPGEPEVADHHGGGPAASSDPGEHQ